MANPTYKSPLADVGKLLQKEEKAIMDWYHRELIKKENRVPPNDAAIELLKDILLKANQFIAMFMAMPIQTEKDPGEFMLKQKIELLSAHKGVNLISVLQSEKKHVEVYNAFFNKQLKGVLKTCGTMVSAAVNISKMTKPLPDNDSICQMANVSNACDKKRDQYKELMAETLDVMEEIPLQQPSIPDIVQTQSQSYGQKNNQSFNSFNDTVKAGITTLIENISGKANNRTAFFSLNTKSKVEKLNAVKGWLTMRNNQNLDEKTQGVILSVIDSICSIRRNPLGFFDSHSKMEFRDWMKENELAPSSSIISAKSVSTIKDEDSVDVLIQTIINANKSNAAPG